MFVVFSVGIFSFSSSLFIRELAKIMAAATDHAPDVAAAIAAVVVEERVTTVLAASGTESEKETVEVESTSIIQVEKKISKEKKRVNPPREKKAKSSLPNQEDREKKQLKKLAPKEKKPKKMPKAANGPAAAHPSYLLVLSLCRPLSLSLSVSLSLATTL